MGRIIWADDRLSQNNPSALGTAVLTLTLALPLQKSLGMDQLKAHLPPALGGTGSQPVTPAGTSSIVAAPAAAALAVAAAVTPIKPDEAALQAAAQAPAEAAAAAEATATGAKRAVEEPPEGDAAGEGGHKAQRTHDAGGGAADPMATAAEAAAADGGR